MTTRALHPISLKSLCLAGFVALGVLTACSDRGSTEVPGGSAPPASTTASAYRPAGLAENDAKLFAAASVGDGAQIGQAVEAGAGINAKDSFERTPLFVAAFYNQPAVVRLLIEMGGNLDVKDSNGMAPLHAAVVMGNKEIAATLIAKGANINIPDAAGHTPLHLAAATNQLALAELLMENGANLRARTTNGITASALAANNGHSKMAAAIKKWKTSPLRSPKLAPVQ